MCNSASLKNIANLCGVNPAGFKQRICLTFTEEILSIPAATANVVTTDITFRAAATTPVVISAGSFRVHNISSKDQDWSVEPLGDVDNPTGFKTAFKFRIHNNDATALDSIAASDGSPLIALAIGLKSGRNRILGALDNPCYLKVMEKETSTDGYLDCEIMWERSAARPLFYTGAIPN